MIFTRCIKSLNYIPFHNICSLEMRTNLFFFFCKNSPQNCWRRIYHWPKRRNSRLYGHSMRLCSPTGWTSPLAHLGTGTSWRGSENVCEKRLKKYEISMNIDRILTDLSNAT